MMIISRLIIKKPEKSFSKKNFKTLNTCPSCKSKSLDSLGKVSTIHPRSRLKVEIIKCNACGHWFTKKMPSSVLLSSLYSSGSLTVVGKRFGKDNKNLDKQNTLVEDDHWVLKALSEKNLAGNMLEIGPGGGALMRSVKNIGWKVYGIDPGNWSSEENIYRNVKDLPKGLKFDALVFQDVLEHCSDPWVEINLYKTFLKNECELFMTFPWSESTEAEMLRSKWAMVRPLGHLHYFSRNSAKSLVESIDMKVINMFVVSYSRINKTKSSFLTDLKQIISLALKRTGPKYLINLLRFVMSKSCSIGDQLYVRAKF